MERSKQKGERKKKGGGRNVGRREGLVFSSLYLLSLPFSFHVLAHKCYSFFCCCFFLPFSLSFPQPFHLLLSFLFFPVQFLFFFFLFFCCCSFFFHGIVFLLSLLHLISSCSECDYSFFFCLFFSLPLLILIRFIFASLVSFCSCS